ITRDRVLEALDTPATFDIVQKGDAQAQTNSSIKYNGTTKTGTSATFHAYIIGNQSVQTVTTSASGATTFTFKNRSKTLTTTSDSITVHNKILTDCGAGTASQTEAIKFVLRSEEEWQNKISGDVDYNLDTSDVKGRNTENYAFNRSGQEVPTCIYPSWAEYRVTGPISYQATDYTHRRYKLSNVLINNQSETYDLYLLPSNMSASIFFELIDSSGQRVPGATIEVLRYFDGRDAYITVAKSETDSEGLANTYLKINEIYYKYVITKGGKILEETERQILACSQIPCTKTIQIDPQTVDPYYQTKQQFRYDCWTNSDDTFQCTVTYNGSAPQKARLTVDRIMTIGENRTCDITVTSSTSSLVCTGLNTSTSQYQFTLVGFVDGVKYVLTTGTFGTDRALFDDNILFAFIAMLAVAGLGYRRPAQTILFATLGFFASAWLELFTVGAGILAGVGFIALILIIQLER
ncbi:MAG: hypothetical protein SVW02_01195, partial [Candidatus Nanohaloarchaea archaeon]|nr:hypothetical protein [Candidatus Nanohaloarchaea archaeon]